MSIYDTLDGSKLRRPGDYKLSDIRLISYRSKNGTNTPDFVGIETMVIEMNIYESIFNKTLSGDMMIVDGQNIIEKLPLTGNERVAFQFFTPGQALGYDFTMETGNPMYVYKVEKRSQLSPRAQAYVLYFCSKEMIENELRVVANAPKLTHSEMVANIVKDPDYLASPKNLFFEPSKGLHKHVFPRKRPFDSIDDVSLVSRSQRFNNSGFYFYETSQGFYYRSLEHMLAVTQDAARPVKARFASKPANVNKDMSNTAAALIPGFTGPEKDIKNEMQIIMKYNIKTQFDQLKNLRNGVYASKLLAHDQFFKTVKEINFDYHINYPDLQHTESGPNGERVDGKGILPLYLRDGQYLSSFPDSTLYLYTDTSNRFLNVNNPPITEILLPRLSQRLAFQSFKIEIIVNGFTGLQAGDLITVEIPSFEPRDGTEPHDYDKIVSGRYLITTIRHQLNRKGNKHIMAIECMKDSIRTGFADEYNDTFIGKENRIDGVTDLYIEDDLIFNTNNETIL
jgi:hypothetical protein